MRTLVSFVLPTRGRPAELARTVAALGALPPACGAEVIVADNAGEPPARVPAALANGWPVRLFRRTTNEGAAARNACAHAAEGAWLVMLDDDSHPLDLGFLDAIRDAGPEVAAIAGEILLPSGLHEQGGLPEVLVGCGAAIRRDDFLSCGGYDAAFGFYVEEYDLCARLIAAGRRIAFDPRLRVLHEKTGTNRDMDLVLERLVRNNGWTIARHAPEEVRAAALESCVGRYRSIAAKEGALGGFERGLAGLEATLGAQRRTPLDHAQWMRFTGESAARDGLARASGAIAGRAVAIVAPGKGADIVARLVVEAGGRLVDAHDAATLVIGTLSPGPILDARDRFAADGRPVVAAWEPADLAQVANA